MINNAARERLSLIPVENEVRAQSFEMREKEFEASARERALADTRDHLLAALRMLKSDRARLQAREVRIAALEAQVEDNRRHLATVIARAFIRNRAPTARKSSAAPPPDLLTKLKRLAILRKPYRRTKPKG